ncbi:MAG: HNH endonuclease [Flavobacteriales bacterium]|nr:HNH endonuclease [Flavobacteriales bacterium]
MVRKRIGYIEAHHVLPVSEMPPGHRTKPEDLVMVCANCHVMLHLRRPWLQHDELIALLQ